MATVGGTGLFAGILINPKEHVSYGTTSGTLLPTLNLPDQSIGALASFAEVIVYSASSAAIGDLVQYDNTTGALSALTPNVLATGSITTTVLTVSAITAGTFAVGQLVTGPNILPNTYIDAILTGSGGVGTYTVSISQTSASAAVTAKSVPASGHTLVPNSTFEYYTLAGAGLGVIRLTN